MGKLRITLGKHLRSLRGDLSQLQFAKKLGISSSSLNRMEIGEQNVTLDTLEHLCRKLKCEAKDLLQEDPTPKRR